MTLAKAFVTGVVTKTPEKRFTQNDMAIAGFTINIDQNNNSLIRVISFGQLAQSVADTIKEGDNVAVEGKLQVNSYKLPNGKDKKVFEINASGVEKMGSNNNANANVSTNDSVVSFDDSIEQGSDLIDEDEIPF